MVERQESATEHGMDALDLPPALEPVVLESADDARAEAVRRARAGAPEGTLVWVQSPTEPRGRLDRAWQPAPGGALHAALVVRPMLPAAECAELAVATALALARAVADVVEHEGVLLRHNELESRIFFVATVNDEVVGWVHLKHPEIDKLAHTAELTVGVLEEYRGHGIGSHLLERGLEWAASEGYEKLYNSVPATNESAIAFLEAHDWEVEAVREDHYRIDDRYVDEVMLARTL
jgi:ribosomal protein S18 acetylase RimI-like enzyme